MCSSSSTEFGWRPSEYGPSARNVVVSNDSCSTRTVTVPYLTPVASVVSPASAMTCSICAGRADVVMSQSLGVRPMIASRTQPPTTNASKPAASSRSMMCCALCGTSISFMVPL